MAIDRVTIGQRLKKARANYNWSVDEAAHRLGLPRGTVVAFENGERPLTVDDLNAFSAAYSLPVQRLVEDADDGLLALLRATPEIESRSLIEREILRHVSICKEGAELERLLGITRRPRPPVYDLPAPADAAEAMEQGAFVARQERQRLGLGDNPITDMADLLTSVGIWASGTQFPDEMSGLFLYHPSIGMVILVNFDHSHSRKRFSYAHEYAHALLDRADLATVSIFRNRKELREVRANAFAAAFLLPVYGVRRFLAMRGKGIPSRLETVIYDPALDRDDDAQLDRQSLVLGSQDSAHRDVAIFTHIDRSAYQLDPVRATHRPIPGSQKISFQDVAALAHAFRISYEAAAYRLKTLSVLNERELQDCLEKKKSGQAYLQMLGLWDDLEGSENLRRADRELITQVVELGIEAFRRGLRKSDSLLELGARLGLGGQQLVALAEAAL